MRAPVGGRHNSELGTGDKMKKLPFAYVSDVYLQATNLVVVAVHNPGRMFSYGNYAASIRVSDVYVVTDAKVNEFVYHKPQDAIQKLFDLWLVETQVTR